MPELSNLVRQRLALGEADTPHPDADTLTAYLEQLLPGPERSQVLAHLAHCSQCREVLAVSLPESPVAPPLVAATSMAGKLRSSFWRPAFGLVASLAALAIVVAVVLEIPKTSVQQKGQQANRQFSAPPVGSNAPAAVPAPPEVVDSLHSAAASSNAVATTSAVTTTSKPALSAGLQQPQLRELRENDRSAPAIAAAAGLAAPGKPAAEAANAYVAGTSRGDYLNMQMFAADAGSINGTTTQNGDLPAAPAPRDRVQNAFLLSNNTQLQVFQDLPPPTPSKKAVHTPAPSSSHFGFILTPLEKEAKQARQFLQRRYIPSPEAASSFAPNTMGGASQFNPTTDKTTVEVSAAAPIVQTETSELKQSPAFSQKALASAGAYDMDRAANNEVRAKVAGAQHGWRVTGSKLQKLDASGIWVEGYSGGSGLEFSVVSPHGQEVWAGGSHAALVHSRDGGVSWERVELGGNASGAITAIVVNGANIQVRTSENQTWSSQDNGKTWILQN